jgi:hypothetical protein
MTAMRIDAVVPRGLRAAAVLDAVVALGAAHTFVRTRLDKTILARC